MVSSFVKIKAVIIGLKVREKGQGDAPQIA